MNNWKYGAVDFDEEKAVILMHFDGPKRAIRCEQVDYATGSYTPCTMKFLKYPTAWIQLHIRLDEKYSYYIEKRHYSTPLCTRIVLVGAEKLRIFNVYFFCILYFKPRICRMRYEDFTSTSSTPRINRFSSTMVAIKARTP